MCRTVLAIDIGNSNVVIGLFADGKAEYTARMLTDISKPPDGYAKELAGILSSNGTDVSRIDGAVLSSVVPDITDIISQAAEKLIGKKPLIASVLVSGIKTDVENEHLLGVDRIANAVSALKKFKPPIVIFDLGTATTVSVVNQDGVFIGGCICPGVKTSLDALSERAAQLPHIEIAPPDNIIAKNTVDCMRAGIVYGTAAMIDAMALRIEEELGEKAVIVATGGLGKRITSYCRREIMYEPDLLLYGLYHIYEQNNRTKDGGPI